MYQTKVITYITNFKLLLGLICDLLWSDPEYDVLDWEESERGVSYVFGSNIVVEFLKKHDLDLICRAH